VRSTILTSQLPVSRWHEQIGDPTLADGILDRLVHNAHRIEMRGDSMRKNRGEAECVTSGLRKFKPFLCPTSGSAAIDSI
jgi:hypothetical protein